MKFSSINLKNLSLFLIFPWLSGCAAIATDLSLTAGDRVEEYTLSNTVIKGTDGSLAVEVNAAYYKDTSSGRNLLRTVRKYLFAEKDAMETAMSSLAATNKATNESYFLIDSFPLSEAKGHYWKVVPEKFGTTADLLNNLPAEIRQSSHIYSIHDSIPYDFKEGKYLLKFQNPKNNFYKTKKLWWGYPVLLFVPVAICVDTVTFPLQAWLALSLWGHEADR